MDTAKEEGREEREREIAKRALKMGLSVDDIVQLTGLSRRAIEQMKTNGGNNT